MAKYEVTDDFELRYSAMAAPGLSAMLRNDLERFETEGWQPEDRKRAEKLWAELNKRIDAQRLLGPPRVRDIRKGDRFIQNGILVWTATSDARHTNMPFSDWRVEVLFPDGSEGVRTWPDEKGDFAVPGLERGRQGQRQ